MKDSRDVRSIRSALPQSYQEARRLGSKFFMGNPCIYDHDGRRYASSRGCVDCIRRRNREQPSRGLKRKRTLPPTPSPQRRRRLLKALKAVKAGPRSGARIRVSRKIAKEITKNRPPLDISTRPKAPRRLTHTMGKKMPPIPENTEDEKTNT